MCYTIQVIDYGRADRELSGLFVVMQMMKRKGLVVRIGVIMLMTVLFAVAGFAYYKFIGCNNGTCAIASSPYLSVIFAATFGGLLGSIVVDRRKKDADL